MKTTTRYHLLILCCALLICGNSIADQSMLDSALGSYNKGVKNSVTAADLIKAINDTTEVKKFVAKDEEELESIKNTLQKLSKKYGNYEYAIELRSKGLEKPKPLESTIKAVQTLKTRYKEIGADIEANKTKQVALLEKLKAAEKEKSIGKVGSISWFFVGAEVINDLSKLSDRVKSGSDMKAELLNSGLRVVENFIPSVPAPFISSPSDVGKAMNDLTIALKNRNKSLEDTAKHFSDLTLDLVIGSHSIESQLARKLDGVPLENVDKIYESVVNDQKESLLKAKKLLDEYRKFLTEERDNAYLKDSKAMFDALINGIDLDITNIRSEISSIKGGKGLNIVMEYANWKAGQELLRLSDEGTQKLKKYSDDMAILATALSKVSENNSRNGPVAWPTVTMQDLLSAITNGGASHIGSASLYASHNNQPPNANINPINTNNYQTQTGSQQTAYSTNSQAFQSSDWIMVTGNAATHMAVGNSFGTITAPDGGQIVSLNNADVQYTVMRKDFFVPTGRKQVTLTFNGNFVTNEYPTYVGTEYDDYATVKITSPSGNVTPVTAFNKSLNASEFKTVNGLPSPLDSTGGQTGFKASTATINVAGGGKVTVEVKVVNVGDMRVPSAVLLNKITAK